MSSLVAHQTQAAIEGTAVSETLTGTGADNVIVAGQGDDQHPGRQRGRTACMAAMAMTFIRGHAGDDRLFGDVGRRYSGRQLRQ